jgi:hypothetical protein
MAIDFKNPFEQLYTPDQKKKKKKKASLVPEPPEPPQFESPGEMGDRLVPPQQTPPQIISPGERGDQLIPQESKTPQPIPSDKMGVQFSEEPMITMSSEDPEMRTASEGMVTYEWGLPVPEGTDPPPPVTLPEGAMPPPGYVPASDEGDSEQEEGSQEEGTVDDWLNLNSADLHDWWGNTHGRGIEDYMQEDKTILWDKDNYFWDPFYKVYWKKTTPVSMLPPETQELLNAGYLDYVAERSDAVGVTGRKTPPGAVRGLLSEGDEYEGDEGGDVEDVFDDGEEGGGQEGIDDIQEEIDEIPQMDYMTGEQYFETLSDEELESLRERFGFDTVEEMINALSGKPVVYGYYDENGDFIVDQELFDQAMQLWELEDLEPQDLQEFLDEQGYDDVQQNYLDLLDEMAGGLSEEQIEQGWEYAAESMGFEDADAYFARLNELLNQADATPDDELTPEQQRALEREIAIIQDENQQMIEALGLESSARALQEAGQLSSQISNYRLKGQLKMQEYNLAKSQQEYENIMSQYNMLQQSGSAQAQQFHELAYANRMAALQGYADQMDQMLEEYGMHLEEIQTHADLTYQSIMASMGYDQQLMQQIATEYMTELQPLLTQLGIDLDQMAMEFNEDALLQQASEQEEASFWNTISQILKIGGFILSMFGL